MLQKQPALRNEIWGNPYDLVFSNLNPGHKLMLPGAPGGRNGTGTPPSRIMGPKSLVVRFLIAIGLLVLAGCATSPTGRSQLMLMSDAEMEQMGVQAFSNLKQKTPVDYTPETNRFVKCVAQAITREVSSGWEVVVFWDESANAFALPGKKIGVNSGLLDLTDNQDQLATVIGHEVAHVLSHHANERVSQELAVETSVNALNAVANPHSVAGGQMMGILGVGAKYGILMPYRRAHESEADILGLELMAKAGFNPLESIQLWKNMEAEGGNESPEFLSSHPSHRSRMDELIEHMSTALALSNQARKRGKRPACR